MVFRNLLACIDDPHCGVNPHREVGLTVPGRTRVWNSTGSGLGTGFLVGGHVGPQRFNHMTRHLRLDSENFRAERNVGNEFFFIA